MLRMIYPGPHFCLRDHLEQMISEHYTVGILFLSHFLSLYQNLDECWNTPATQGYCFLQRWGLLMDF